MKFLAFNLVVGAALIYLFNGTDGGLQRGGETALAAFDTNRPKTETPVVTPIVAKAGASVVKLQSEHQVPIQEKSEVPPSLPDPIEVPVLKSRKAEPVRLAPEVLTRRDEILNTGTLESPESNVTALMTRQDRSQALMQLAEEMEYFSAKAIGF